MLFMVLLSYFLVTGGIIYDVIVEPPSIGSTTDERGHSRPVAFMQYRINGQGGKFKQSVESCRAKQLEIPFVCEKCR